MDQCHDSLNAEVPASAKIGEIGGKICFDTKKIADEFHDLSQEEVMIRLAALAFHEHVHHFQKPETDLKINEDEAYNLSAYVKITAKLTQIPVLKWSDANLEQAYYTMTATHDIVFGANSLSAPLAVPEHVYDWIGDECFLNLNPKYSKTVEQRLAAGDILRQQDLKRESYSNPFSVGLLILTLGATPKHKHFTIKLDQALFENITCDISHMGIDMTGVEDRFADILNLNFKIELHKPPVQDFYH
jgi:hypothetical protein